MTDTQSQSCNEQLTAYQSDNPEEIKAMKRYEILMRMGFDTDSTWNIAQKYESIELCVDYLTKNTSQYENEDSKSSDNTQSIVGSVFKMMYSFSDTEKDEKHIDNINEDVIETDILCICGTQMILKDSTNCYNNTNYLFVICDKCNKKCLQNSKVYNCPKFKIKQHADGYDICENCALEKENINIETFEQKTDEIVVDLKPKVNESKVIKRALIIQALSEKDNIQCKDAIELEKAFSALGYQVDIILPSDATRKNINTALDKLYCCNESKNMNTYTVICYTGHGYQTDKSFCFQLKDYETYYDKDLYKKINHKIHLNYFQSVTDGYFNQNTNQTLLLINACHSGTLIKQNKIAQQQRYKDEKISQKRKNQTKIFAIVCAIGFLFYLIRSYDDKTYIGTIGKQFVSNVIENKPKVQNTAEIAPNAVSSSIEHKMKDINPKPIVNTNKQMVNGYEKAADLVEREMGNSTDINWCDLKNDLLGRWRKWRGSEEQFVEHHSKLLMKEACKKPSIVKFSTDTNKASVNLNSVVETISMDRKYENVNQWLYGENGSNIEVKLLNPMERETWKDLGNYFNQCISNQWKSSVLGTPIVSICSLVAGAWKYWMRSRTSNTSDLITSCKADQTSSFVGGVSPFFRSVMNYMEENGCKNEGILNRDELDEQIDFDAKNKDIGCGITLDILGQQPQSHFMTK
eukprot:460898_1